MIILKGGDKMDMKIKRGQILRQLRLERQLTQNEAAENFGISQQTYQKYESGKTEATYDLLCDFAKFYGVTTDYLLGREPLNNPLAVLNAYEVDDDEFMRLYDELPDFAKQIFVDTMAQLAKARKSEKVGRKRHVERACDIEDRLEQEQEKAKRKDVI